MLFVIKSSCTIYKERKKRKRKRRRKKKKRKEEGGGRRIRKSYSTLHRNFALTGAT